MFLLFRASKGEAGSSLERVFFCFKTKHSIIFKDLQRRYENSAYWLSNEIVLFLEPISI